MQDAYKFTKGSLQKFIASHYFMESYKKSALVASPRRRRQEKGDVSIDDIMESPAVAVSNYTVGTVDGGGGGASIDDMVQKGDSLLSSPPSNDKVPSRRLEKDVVVAVQEEEEAPPLSAKKKTKKSSSSSSPRRKKQQGCLGAFLSKYDDKEQQQRGRGERRKHQGIFSSNSSFTGSIGSESTGSRKSTASMPSRMPMMFQRSVSSGRSDTNKEPTVSSSSSSPVKCSTASPNNKGRNQDCIDNKQDTFSSPLHKSPLRTASFSPRHALQRTSSLMDGGSKKSPSRCASYHVNNNNNNSTSMSKADSNLLSNGSHHGPRREGTTPYGSPVRSRLHHRDGLVKTPSQRSFRELGDQAIASYEKIVSEFEIVNDKSSSSSTADRSEKLQHARGGAGGLAKTPSQRSFRELGDSFRELGDHAIASYEKMVADFEQEVVNDSTCNAYCHQKVHHHDARGGGGGGLLVKTPSQRMNDMGEQVVASYDKLLSEFDKVDDNSRDRVSLSAPSRREQGAKFTAAMSGRIEGVRKALPGPPLLLQNNNGNTLEADESAVQTRNRRPADDAQQQPRRVVNRNVSEESLSLLLQPTSSAACPKDDTKESRQRQVNRSTSEESLAWRQRQGSQKPSSCSTPEEMINSYLNILSDFNDSSDMDNLLACASCSSLNVDNLLLLNSCNSMDISNNLVAGGESCSTVDVKHLLDMDSSCALDDSLMNDDVSCEQEEDEDNNDSTPATKDSNNNNNWRTTAKPALASFRKPRPVLPNKRGNNNAGGGGALSAIPRRTRKLE